ncbi:hypothetical protein IQ266_11150 [filamentous cyanobacterium LEGE 11480]|uniref:Uncharacterized protein n=1 Tax=Romeriopsis navalis LEGE 11480 TaxID=2777977 RepID=A0A928Z4G4_9CYAN|nr:hypothetical protein [Romeriopsis navalis]MBE9030288.1 hypothetical protein [Romeriopsis navalis LEGE 11480]
MPPFITYAILAAGTLINIGFMLYAGEPDQLWWWPFFIALATWSLFPYGTVITVFYWLRQKPKSQLLLTLAAVLLTGSTAFLLHESLIANPDPQSGLVFVVLPVYQWIAILPLMVIVSWLQR